MTKIPARGGWQPRIGANQSWSPAPLRTPPSPYGPLIRRRTMGQDVVRGAGDALVSLLADGAATAAGAVLFLHPSKAVWGGFRWVGAGVGLVFGIRSVKDIWDVIQGSR